MFVLFFSHGLLEFIISSLICAHFFQDLDAWQQGLRFLMGDSDSDAKTAQQGPPVPSPETAQLKAQEELNERLQQENQMLREMIKRKDATIAAAGLEILFGKTEGDNLETFHMGMVSIILPIKRNVEWLDFARFDLYNASPEHAVCIFQV